MIRSLPIAVTTLLLFITAAGCGPRPRSKASGGVITLKTGMKVVASSRRGYTRPDPRGNGKTQRVVEARLAADWRDAQSGMVFKQGSLFKGLRSGGLLEFTLAQPYREKRNNFVVGAGRPVKYYASNVARSIPVGEDYLFKNGMSAKAGSTIEYHPNGKIRLVNLARDWKYNSRGLILQAGTEAEFDAKGLIKRCTPARDYIISLPGTNMKMKCPANQEMKF
jgi:hypothetical protein